MGEYDFCTAAVNRTEQKNPKIVEKATVRKILPQVFTKDMRILDYGSGKNMAHTKYFNKKKYHVTPCDVGGNAVGKVRNCEEIKSKFEGVFASSVLNVQPHRKCVARVLDEASRLLRPGGRFIANYPEPYKSDVDRVELELMMRRRFRSVEKIGKGGSQWYVGVK